LQKVRFDTVDSTTWFACQKFGVIYVWKGTKMIAYHSRGQGKKDRKKFSKYLKAIGCDIQKVMDDDIDEVRKCNVTSWRIFGERLEEAQKRRAWATIDRTEGKSSVPLKERCDELRREHARLLERIEGD